MAQNWNKRIKDLEEKLEQERSPEAHAARGAYAQLDRQGAHRPKVVPNKKRQQERRACRDWR